MNKRDKADQFSHKVDQLLQQTGVADRGKPSAEDDELMALAQQLATTDFSRDSRVRHKLRRKLLTQSDNSEESSLTKTVEVPGLIGELQNVWKRRQPSDLRVPRRRNALVWGAPLLAVLLIFAATLFFVPAASEFPIQMSRWWVDLNARSIATSIALPEQSVSSQLISQWQQRAEGGFSSAPAISGGWLYVGSNDGNLYALDMQNGETQWQFATDSSIEVTPTVVGGTVYVGNTVGDVYAIDAETGQETWHFNSGAAAYVSPMLGNGTIFVGSGTILSALNIETGQPQWQVSLDGLIESAPVIAQNRVLVSSQDWNLYAFDVETRQEVWRFKTNDWLVASPLVVEDTVYFGGNDKTFYAVDVQTGEELWRYVPENDISVATPTYARGLIYFSGFGGNLYALNAQTGEEVWQVKIGNSVRGSAIFAHDLIYAPSGSGYLHALDPLTGLERGRFETEEQIYTTPIAIEFNNLTSGENAQYVYLVDGKGTLYQVQNQALVGPTSGADLSNPVVASDIISSAQQDFQFTPGAWYVDEPGDEIRFYGRIVDGAGNPVDGITIRAENDTVSLISTPSGPNQEQPEAEAGTWSITISNIEQNVGWWWLTIVRDECVAAGETFDPTCSDLSRLSESVKIELRSPDVLTINADWLCHRECD